MKPQSADQTTQSWLKEAQKGYIRMGVLILLNKKPSHGYEIMKEINNRTKGFWQPTPGGVYPILRDLEKSAYIKGQWETQKGRKLKVYKITKSGTDILKRAIVKQSEIFTNISNLFTEFSREVLNIEPSSPMPAMPSPFSPFLEEESSGEEKLKKLESQRTHLREVIKANQERLKQLDRSIADIKKQAKPDAKTSPE